MHGNWLIQTRSLIYNNVLKKQSKTPQCFLPILASTVLYLHLNVVIQTRKLAQVPMFRLERFQINTVFPLAWPLWWKKKVG